MLVGVVILNYNTFEDTIRLVGELQSQTVVSLVIAVVDNASPNGSYDKLKPLESKYANVVVLQTGQNLGYAKGNNYGLRYLLRNVHPQYLAVLNNDVFLPSDCFERLCRRYKLLDRPAFVAPLMLDNEGCSGRLTYKLHSFWGDCQILFYLPRMVVEKVRLWTNAHAEGNKRDKVVDIVPGSFLFFSPEVLQKVGYFYPGTFLYGEERFIAFRVRQQSLKNYIIQDQTFVHDHHSPTISSVYGEVDKFRMLYDSWLLYTLECRSHGKLKASILKPLMKYSLWEIKTMTLLKSKLRW